jgi:glyoxylase-like metal-dependent hydrolase (beta-lactamase superfamily II)
MFNRRHFLGVAGLSLCAPCITQGVAQGLAQGLTQTQAHKFTLGEMEITIFSDGIFSIPLSVALPNTPPDVIESLFNAHQRPLKREGTLNIMLVKTATDLILIDCGANINWAPTLGLLPQRLEAAGVKAETITKVILTHGHPDHLWGALDDFNAPAFPNATYIFPAKERDYWLNPDTLTQLPDARKAMAVAALRYLKTLAPVIVYKNHDDSCAPGVFYRATYGHTPGHMAVRLESKGQQLLVLGDALTHEVISFAEPQWAWGSDVQQEIAAQTRIKLLGELAADKINVVGYHLPYPGVGRVEKYQTAFKFINTP